MLWQQDRTLIFVSSRGRADTNRLRTSTNVSNNPTVSTTLHNLLFLFEQHLAGAARIKHCYKLEYKRNLSSETIVSDWNWIMLLSRLAISACKCKIYVPSFTRSKILTRIIRRWWAPAVKLKREIKTLSFIYKPLLTFSYVACICSYPKLSYTSFQKNR